ncbi:glutathione S-transferase [Bosea sp. BH3]|uniref:glutathione S-transferase n=1 Tax=Bosea sp. BH3 TaxID=2871701 RepID=UPI0021CB0C03|nr:glutathione S-transferase [Bosea sp. BH3]MCU4180962.1 glutathione S-transferase [Bosea sp. BH3]
MLVLRSSPASPFGRKVKMAAIELGLMDRIEVVAADTNDPAEPLRQQNPLGKIPTLVLEDGTTLFDSRVIVEYLDHLAGGRIFPAGEARFAQLRLMALADGMADAALLQVYEGRYRPEEGRNANWVAHQAGKVARGLEALEAAPPAFPDRPRIGEIALACTLGYLDLRFEGKWRADFPKLVAWLDDFAARVPAFETTRFKG